MMKLLSAVALLALVGAGQAQAACPHYNATDGKYVKADGTSELACAGTFTVAFKNAEKNSGTTPCEDVRGAKCLPKLSVEDKPEVWMYAPAGTDMTVASEWEFRSCYSAPDRAGRKWRKFNKDPATAKSHHCTFKFGGGLSGADANALIAKGEPIVKYSVNNKSPDSNQYMVALGKDSTGAYTHIASHDGFYQINVESGIDAGMVTAAIIMSLLSVASLIGFFVVEKMLANRKAQ